MAFDFYFAGTQCKEADDVICNLNANVLKSYINDRKSIQDWFNRKRNGWKGKLMIDNGAFTVHRKGGSICIDEYIEWLNTNDEYIDYAIALDEIPGTWGHPKTAEQVRNSPLLTWKNYVYMTERLKSPERLLPVFHMGEDFSHLENMCNSDKLLSKYICISGNKELTNSAREDWYIKCFNIIRRSKQPDMKVHCLGSATISNAEKFPFTSMDATSWIMTGANGGILTDFGVVSVGNKSKLSNIEKKIITNVVSKYGVSYEDIQNNYKARMIVNVKYLYAKSQSCKNSDFKVTRKRLF